MAFPPRGANSARVLRALEGVGQHRGGRAHHEAGDEQQLLEGDGERRAGLVLPSAVGEAAVVDLVADLVVAAVDPVAVSRLREAELLHVVLRAV